MISMQTRKELEKIVFPMIAFADSSENLLPELITDGMCTFTGATREEVVEYFKKDPYESVHPDDVEMVKKIAERFFLEHTAFDIIFRFRKRHETEYSILHTIAKYQPMEDGSETILVGFNDMNNTGTGMDWFYNSVNNRIDENLLKDMVTGLPNMFFLWQIASEKMGKMISTGQKAAIIYFDVIAMHSYNTRYGYEKGNELLRLYAQEIANEFDDSALARAADDHFVLLDEFKNEEEIKEKIRRIIQKVKKRAYGSTDGIRAGVYVIEPGSDAVRGLDCARRALKDIGNDRSVFYSIYSAEKEELFWKERYILETFDAALQNKWIKVYYQPIMRTKTQKIAALEALARWIDPVRGTIMPGEFIPVLSHHHLLYKLDLFMAEQVAHEFTIRKEAGLNLVPVSVNFSAQDFDYADIPAKLKEIVEKNGITTGDIIVEITEQDIAKGTKRFEQQLKQIRENGHRLWIDDFGSGYSSLNVLSQYKADRIKIDMNILHHLDDNNGANRVIMKALVDVGKELGLHTLSEGVETKEQIDFLEEIGCEMLQGFYFFRATSVEEAIYRVKKGNPRYPSETREEFMSFISDYPES